MSIANTTYQFKEPATLHYVFPALIWELQHHNESKLYLELASDEARDDDVKITAITAGEPIIEEQEYPKGVTQIVIVTYHVTLATEEQAGPIHGRFKCGAELDDWDEVWV